MGSNPPSISVIMPCYNAAHVIEQTIANLYQQTHKDFELIVIDDGSTDQSLLVLQQLPAHYPNLKIIHQNNRGPGSARNQGITAACGRFIAFLDADDSWHPECLSKLYQALTNAPDCVLAYCGWQNTGLTANRCKPYIPPDYEHGDKLALLLHSCPWPIHAALTYKSAIEKAHGFDEKWLTAEDFNMWFRIAAFNKIIRIPEVLAYYHHQQGEQISGNRLRAVLNHWEVQKALLCDFPEILQLLGSDKVASITDGELLKNAQEQYWHGDLYSAHVLFRKILFLGYIKFGTLKYLLPSLLPFYAYQLLVSKLRS